MTKSVDGEARPQYHLQVTDSPESASTAAAVAVPGRLGLWHLALSVPTARYDATVRFYREAMAMAVDWQPDEDAIYLSSGRDNLALHRVREVERRHSALDHLGFMVPSAEAVAQWHARLAGRAESLEIEILAAPRLHRDGATSFYLLDPAGNKLQIVHVPSVES